MQASWNLLIFILVCSEQLTATPLPSPFISAFLQHSPLRSYPRPRPYYHNHNPPDYYDGSEIISEEGRKKASAEETDDSDELLQTTHGEVEPSHHYQQSHYHHHDRPTTHQRLSQISSVDTEANHPDSAPHDDHTVPTHEGYEAQPPYSNKNNHQRLKKGLRMYLLTPIDLSQQYQIVLIKHPDKNRNNFYNLKDKPVYESSRNPYHHGQQYPEDHRLPREEPRGETEYNYFDQLKQGPKNEYGVHLPRNEQGSKSKLDFDSANNHGYAPSMLHQNYEVSMPKSSLKNGSPEISPFMYAPSMTYQYYGSAGNTGNGVGGQNVTLFNIPQK